MREMLKDLTVWRAALAILTLLMGASSLVGTIKRAIQERRAFLDAATREQIRLLDTAGEDTESPVEVFQPRIPRSRILRLAATVLAWLAITVGSAALAPGALICAYSSVEGRHYLGLQDYARALDFYQHIYEYDPVVRNASQGLDNAMEGRDLDAGDFGMARRAVQRYPNDWRSHQRLAYAFVSRKDMDSAITEYRKASDLDPRNAVVMVDLGNALQSQNRFTEAIKVIRRAQEIDPGLPRAPYFLGNAYFRMGDMSHAIEAFARAIQLDPNMGPAYFNMAQAQQRIGNTQAAIKTIDRCLKIAETNSDLTPMIAQLQEKRFEWSTLP